MGYVKKNVKACLELLDRTYGVEKEGFLHEKDWQLLVAIMLSAQSTDKQVDQVLPSLWKKYPDLESVILAEVGQMEKAISTIGLHKSKARNIKACCKKIVEEFGGQVPKTVEELVSLAGVGRKTATLFLADYYGIPGVTVDTHVFRISKRLGWATGNNPVQVERELMKALPKEHWNRINFQLIYHGRSICTARKAKCEKCMLKEHCKQVEVS